MNIFQIILNIFVNFIIKFKEHIRLWSSLFGASLVAIVAHTVDAIGYVWELLKMLSGALSNSGDTVNNAKGFVGEWTPTSGFGYYLDAANTFLPLDFCFAALTVYASVMVVGMVVRLIISLIPTVG